MTKELNIYLANPRGFCAGVKRAISLVEEALQKHGEPVYVRHEIVHNKHVVDNLRQKGAIFIEEFDEIKDSSRPVVLSAHGVEKAVIREADRRGLQIIDATCPLVSKVHKQIQKLDAMGMEIVVIGKKEHPEIIGTVGQLDNLRHVHIINSIEQAQNLKLPQNKKIGTITQTTLAIDEAQAIIKELTRRFGELATLDKNDICYATTHRQKAIKELAAKTPNIIVIGSKNSSNSKHLKESALQHGAKQAWLIDDVSEVDWQALKNIESLGISAGASAPEYLVEDLLKALETHYEKIKIQNVIVAVEKIEFKS